MNTLNIRLSDLSQEERELFDLLLKKEGMDLSQLPIPRRSPGSFTPLSFTQHRLWSSGQFAPGMPYGNVEIAFRIGGALQPQLVKKCFEEIVRRHEILRTTFPNISGQTTQVIAETIRVNFLEVDLREFFKVGRYEEAIKRGTEEVRRPFDHNQDFLLRVTLLRLDEEDCLLVITTHHLVTDGWGMRVMLREFAALYQAQLAGVASPLPEPPIQYADFAIWQREWLAGETLETQLGYWRKQLDGAPPELEVPLDHPRPQVPSFRSATYNFEFSKPLSDALRALSRKEGITLYTTLLAGFQALFYCYSRQQVIVVGTTISNRSRNETENLIGNFGNNLLLRTDVSDDPSFRILLNRVRDVVIEGYAHQDLPLEVLIEHLQQEGQSARIPQFQVMFILRDSTLAQNIDIPGLTITSVPLEIGTAALDLKLDLMDGADRLSGFMEYKHELFEPATIAQMMGHYQVLLEHMVADPERRLSSLPIESKAKCVARLESAQGAATGRGGVQKRTFTAPRDPLELQLAKIWEETFSIEPIGVTDNFFDLGGHSLVAVSLFSRIEKLTGKNLPLATLFQAPTIEQIAKILRQDGWAPPWSSLVAIKPNGSKPPFYCIHGVGGNILEFIDMTRYVDQDQPLYGIQAQGLDGKKPRHRSVEEMAAHYIKEMRSLQPQGPYYLGGSSFGGLVAYEISQQLLAQGQKVGLLALFDTHAPGYPAFLPSVTPFRKKWFHMRHRFELHWGNLLSASPTGKRDYIWAKTKKIWKDIKKHQIRKRYRRLKAKLEGLFLPKAILEVQKSGFQANNTYVPKPYPGAVTLFRATEQPYGIYPDRTCGWKDYALGGIEIHDVPGHHGAIVREPRVPTLVQSLSACLNAAYAQHSKEK